MSTISAQLEQAIREQDESRVTEILDAMPITDDVPTNQSVWLHHRTHDIPYAISLCKALYPYDSSCALTLILSPVYTE